MKFFKTIATGSHLKYSFTFPMGLMEKVKTAASRERIAICARDRCCSHVQLAKKI